MMDGYDPHDEMAKANLLMIGAAILALVVVITILCNLPA